MSHSIVKIRVIEPLNSFVNIENRAQGNLGTKQGVTRSHQIAKKKLILPINLSYVAINIT